MKEVHDILNSTLLKNSLKLKVVKDNLETKVGVGYCSSQSKRVSLQTLSVNGFGTISPSTEPQPQPSFDGYSGGSMVSAVNSRRLLSIRFSLCSACSASSSVR